MNKRSRADQFTLKAKQLGYPARSVFKLEEIQRKLSVIQKKATVLDIGAAPGSWTLYTLRLLGPGRKGPGRGFITCKDYSAGRGESGIPARRHRLTGNL